MSAQPYTHDAGFITRGEFRQFERRMDDSFVQLRQSMEDSHKQLGQKVDSLHATVAEIVEEDDQAEWLGPRSWMALRIVAPASVGGLIAWLVANFTG